MFRYSMLLFGNELQSRTHASTESIRLRPPELVQRGGTVQQITTQASTILKEESTNTPRECLTTYPRQNVSQGAGSHSYRILFANNIAHFVLCHQHFVAHFFLFLFEVAHGAFGQLSLQNKLGCKV